jgi:transcriptional regulator with XRE-family HTH domain
LKTRHHYRIRAYRVDRGLSLRELAAMVGIGRMEMTKIDAGERLIDETLQAALAEALGIDPKEIDYAVDHPGKV